MTVSTICQTPPNLCLFNPNIPSVWMDRMGMEQSRYTVVVDKALGFFAEYTRKIGMVLGAQKENTAKQVDLKLSSILIEGKKGPKKFSVSYKKSGSTSVQLFLAKIAFGIAPYSQIASFLVVKVPRKLGPIKLKDKTLIINWTACSTLGMQNFKGAKKNDIYSAAQVSRIVIESSEGKRAAFNLVKPSIFKAS